MHSLYTQVQQLKREMQVQEYTYRSRIQDLELELNERTSTGECYKKAVVVFTLVVFVMSFLVKGWEWPQMDGFWGVCVDEDGKILVNMGCL